MNPNIMPLMSGASDLYEQARELLALDYEGMSEEELSGLLERVETVYDELDAEEPEEDEESEAYGEWLDLLEELETMEEEIEELLDD